MKVLSIWLRALDPRNWDYPPHPCIEPDYHPFSWRCTIPTDLVLIP